jgi:DNA polymerase-1
MKKLFLIDGHALIFRTYYAFLRRPMVNSKGEDTSILFGFTKILTDLIIKEKPTHLAVAFDPPAKTFRHEIFPEYKANRSETPELIKSALEPLKDILSTLCIPVIMKEGFEADDVIGTISKRAENKGFEVYMVTPDKDYGQLISNNIVQYKPGKSGDEAEIIDRQKICDYFGIDDPIQVIDILTIWGDASDNIPGIRGIGEVGSKKLVSKYKTVENIYNSLNELPEKQRAAFEEAKDRIQLSKHLVTIDTNVDVELDEEQLKLEMCNFEEFKNIINRYEFSSLSRSINKLESIFNLTGLSAEPSKPSISSSQTIAYKSIPAEKFTNSIGQNAFLGIKILGESVILSDGGNCCEFKIKREGYLRQIFSNSSTTFCGYDLKQLCTILCENGLDQPKKLYDIELMHYLLMPERAHKVEILAKSYLNIDIEQEKTVVQGSLFGETTSETSSPIEQTFRESCIYVPLAKALEAELINEGVLSLYVDIEMPLIGILAEIERTGVMIDCEMLNKYSSELSSELATIEDKIREIADEPTLNVSSPKQLGILLYDKLKLTGKAKTTSKKNYSTDEETLNEFYDAHPIIPLILEFRNIKKLLSTYIEPLPSLISPKSGKIHTTYNQALTATGRLSSVKPNLQNIPIRTARGREIRKAFIPSREDGLIMSADYSQIELRLMAHMSGDPDFIEAFNSGKDIHTATAAKIFKISEEEVTKEMRSRAKTANFGIIYGISAFGLSQRLNISRSDSKQLIDDYFAAYPKVKEFMNNMIVTAGEKGYVETLYGRKRYLPDIKSRNQVVRGLAERNAINAPLQGTAADIIKVAMIKVAEELKRKNFKSEMILQVHDELVFDTFPEEVAALEAMVKEQMESVIKLSIPLTAECSHGKNWLEAH